MKGSDHKLKISEFHTNLIDMNSTNSIASPQCAINIEGCLVRSAQLNRVIEPQRKENYIAVVPNIVN